VFQGHLERVVQSQSTSLDRIHALEARYVQLLHSVRATRIAPLALSFPIDGSWANVNNPLSHEAYKANVENWNLADFGPRSRNEVSDEVAEVLVVKGDGVNLPCALDDEVPFLPSLPTRLGFNAMYENSFN